MSSEAKKYKAYADECVHLAARATTREAREKLMNLARIWTEAAVTEDECARLKQPSPSTNPSPTRRIS
jgi:hypothetical protein